MPRRVYVVYLVRNLLDGKRYIGKTSGRSTDDAIKKRWHSHLSQAKTEKGWLLHRAMRKYGHTNFKIGAIGTFKREQAAFEVESHWIARIAPEYNLAPGGCAIKTGKYVRVKFSDVQIIRKEARATGLKTYSTGKPCRDGHDSPRYVSTAQCCECHRLRHAKKYIHKGFQRTPEFKTAISRTMIGKPKSVETRVKMAAAAKVRAMNPEWRAKMAAIAKARRGKELSPEHRIKLSIARRRNVIARYGKMEIEHHV